MLLTVRYFSAPYSTNPIGPPPEKTKCLIIFIYLIINENNYLYFYIFKY